MAPSSIENLHPQPLRIVRPHLQNEQLATTPTSQIISSADTPSTPSKNPHIKESGSSLSPAHTPEKRRVRQGEDVDIPDSSPASYNQIQQGILSREEALQLQIRIAVLENELSHARRAQEEAMNGTIHIVRAFSTSLTLGNGAFLQHSNVEELQIQNLRLKQENDRLWLLVGAPATKGRQEDHVISNPGVAEMSFARLFDPTESFNPQLRGNKVAGASNAQGSYALKKDFGGVSKTGGRVVDVQRESFDNNSSTVPNTPRNSAQDVSKPPVPRSKEHLNRVISSSKVISYDDIGLPSLDDVLDDVPQSRFSRFDDDLPIEEQIVQNLNPGMALVDLPKPVSLVTGFQITGSFRGDQYDACLATWRADGNPASSRQDPDHRIRSDYDRGGHSGPRPEDESFDSLKNQFFISREEREATIEEHQRSMRREDNDRAFPDFFRYGIQYLPRAGETNYSRTIVIGPLPQSMRLLDLLDRVRGGPIVSSMLLSSRAMNNLGGNTAVIQFLDESSANDYQSYAKTHPNVFSDKEVKVKFIETPTYHQYSAIRLMRDRGSTRLVVVDNPPRGLHLEGLYRDIIAGNPWRAAALLDVWVDSEPDSFGGQRLVLEFSSVSAAKFAFAILSHWERYRLLKVGFAPDPCAGPVEELELPFPERQQYLPSISDFGADRDLRQEMNIQQQILNLQRKRLAAWSNNKVENNERKRLAALNNIKVEIPSFSGEGITSGTNWADEVNDEFDDANASHSGHSDDEVVEKEGEVDDTTPSLCKAMATTVIEEEIGSIFVVEESEDNMGRKLQKRRPTHVHTGSKYATLLPAFSDSVTTSASKERAFGGTSVETIPISTFNLGTPVEVLISATPSIIKEPALIPQGIESIASLEGVVASYSSVTSSRGSKATLLEEKQNVSNIEGNGDARVREAGTPNNDIVDSAESTPCPDSSPIVAAEDIRDLDGGEVKHGAVPVISSIMTPRPFILGTSHLGNPFASPATAIKSNRASKHTNTNPDEIDLELSSRGDSSASDSEFDMREHMDEYSLSAPPYLKNITSIQHRRDHEQLVQNSPARGRGKGLKHHRRALASEGP